ncbi:MAG TPA: hypothetical protein VF950_09170, partial [Planctomycetota bacterium]
DARINRQVQQCNMAGIIGAVLLHSGKLDDCLRLDERVRSFSQDIQMLDRRRVQIGRSPGPVPDHVEKGDRLVAIDDVLQLDPGAPRAFAEGLKTWLRTFKAGRKIALHVMRGGQRVTIQADFPEKTKDLNALAHLVDVILGEANGVDIVAPPSELGPKALPADLVADIDRKLSTLHPYHRERVLSANQDRPRKLLQAGSGTPEDVEFLRQRVLADLVPAAAAEIEDFRTRSAELEPRALQGGASAPDVIVFKDGRRLEGTLEPLPDGKARLRKGPISMTVSPDDVLRIEKGKGTVNEFVPRWTAAKGKRPELEGLLRWAAEKNLKEARQLTAFAILILDPGHEAARTAAGYVKDGAGAWTRGDPVAGANGTIEWHGRIYTPQELARELSSLGHVNVNGVWLSRTQGVYKIDNLYRDVERLLLRSGSIVPMLQNAEDMVYDVRSKSWVPRAKTVSTGRYLGGAPVLLEVNAPGEILECRVRARGQVAQVGGSVRVSIVSFLKDPAAKAVYSINAPGEHWQSIDVTDKVRGATSFLIQADVYQGGLFLPSDSNDLGILEVRYTWGQPMKRINDLLGVKAPAPPVTTEIPAVEAAVRRLADVHAEIRILTDMLREMRAAVETMTYAKDVEIPVRFQGMASLIEDPLRPKLDGRPAAQLLQIGEWWGGLAADDRRAFAYVYGLWCARSRTLGR